MLEALTRLHYKAFDVKLFDKWNNRFKKLEDVFGRVDEYASLESQFATNQKITGEAIKYCTVNKENYLSKCNMRLSEKDWLGNKMLSFGRGLKALGLFYDKHYVNGLRIALIREVDNVSSFTLKTDYQFTEIEAQVHEIRRKLRWFSIYVQALCGLIQVKESGKRKKYEVGYFTKEIIDSPFNKIAPKPADMEVIEFDRDSFLALNWLINELGKLKDSVLTMYQLRDAVFVTENVTKEEATQKALKALGLKSTAEEDALKKASDLIRAFMAKDKMLDNLIVR